MSRTILVVIVLLGAICLGSSPLAGQESGSAAVNPWSGYWYPHKQGGLVGPLTKYDRLLGKKAAPWEDVKHVQPAKASSDSDWWGYCHAWSAAAVSEKEPKQGSVVRGVDFSVGDKKGLLCACHAQDASNFYGDRYEGPADDKNDLRPDALWRVLQLYLGRDRIPLILDLDAGTQVWNYPIYQYRVDQEAGAGGWESCTMQLLLADDDVEPDYVGTRASLRTYTFRVKLENGAVVEGTGEWTGESIEDHPDFAWYPQVAQAENPEVDIAQVATILGYPVGGENPPIATPPTTPPETPGSGNAGNGPVVDVPAPMVNTTPVPPAPEVQFANILSPQELLDLVTNKTSHFKLDAFVEGGDGARFDAGKEIKISCVSGEAGYLYLFDVGPEGELTLLFPLAGENNQLVKDKQFNVPSGGKQPRLAARGHGQHDIKSLVLAKPITISGFGNAAYGRSASEAGDQGQKGKPQVAPNQPQQLMVCTTTQKRVRGRLLRFFRKGMEEDAVAPGKVPKFAQDSTSYFVFDARKPNQGQKPGGKESRPGSATSPKEKPPAKKPAGGK
ncbi:MAG: DUF4384 domain-containing protein [Pirellulaceae bacterium]